jgi:hypothetical protein
VGIPHEHRDLRENKKKLKKNGKLVQKTVTTRDIKLSQGVSGFILFI